MCNIVLLGRAVGLNHHLNIG